MDKPTNMFDVAQKKRKQEQEKTENQLLKNEEPKSENKIRMNIMLPPAYKERLQKEAAAQHVSASHLILTWIDEHCK